MGFIVDETYDPKKRELTQRKQDLTGTVTEVVIPFTPFQYDNRMTTKDVTGKYYTVLASDVPQIGVPPAPREYTTEELLEEMKK